MSKVLYRKYRPKSFSDIIGQTHVVKTLKNAIRNDNISHAYLFTGPRGTGKTTMARLLAKAVNCQDNSSAEPCNECEACESIIEGNAVDLIEIDAASHRGIDEIRQLREGIKFSPNQLKYKVYIIDESHQLTKGAANALLKTLEEAPDHAIFVLATTEPQKMISTIISRCQRFDFRKLNLSEIIEKLERILKAEGIESDKRSLEIIATAAGGSFRDAESLLDQVLTFTEEKLEEEDVKSLLGLVETQYIFQFVDLLIKEERLKAIKYLEKMYTEGVNLEEFHSSLLEYLRQLMTISITNADLSDEESSVITGLRVSFTDQEMKKLKKQASNLKPAEVNKMLEIFLKAGKRMDYSPISQLPIEMAIVEITT
ncbi:MAG: DNA polymerase III subunit gamma/tau [Patescibacteria group bacterium]